MNQPCALIHYPSGQGGLSYLLRLPTVSHKNNFPKSLKINPLLTKLGWSRWLDIGLNLFCEFMDRDSISVHKHVKNELGQHPAILTKQAWQ